MGLATILISAGNQAQLKSLRRTHRKVRSARCNLARRIIGILHCAASTVGLSLVFAMTWCGASHAAVPPNDVIADHESAGRNPVAPGVAHESRADVGRRSPAMVVSRWVNRYVSEPLVLVLVGIALVSVASAFRRLESSGFLAGRSTSPTSVTAFDARVASSAGPTVLQLRVGAHSSPDSSLHPIDIE